MHGADFPVGAKPMFGDSEFGPDRRNVLKKIGAATWGAGFATIGGLTVVDRARASETSASIDGQPNPDPAGYAFRTDDPDMSASSLESEDDLYNYSSCSEGVGEVEDSDYDDYYYDGHILFVKATGGIQININNGFDHPNQSGKINICGYGDYEVWVTGEFQVDDDTEEWGDGFSGGQVSGSVAGGCDDWNASGEIEYILFSDIPDGESISLEHSCNYCGSC